MPPRKATVALANKMARIAWARLAKQITLPRAAIDHGRPGGVIAAAGANTAHHPAATTTPKCH
jgi:hypothetical protein